jgi:hypothetical protein
MLYCGYFQLVGHRNPWFAGLKADWNQKEGFVPHQPPSLELFMTYTFKQYKMNTVDQINYRQMFYNQWIMTQRQMVGDALYSVVQSNLAAGYEVMVQSRLWHPAITAGKIVGMFLDGLSGQELQRAMTDSPYLAELMVDACEVIMESVGQKPFE